jgi:SUMO ligase MMS21 Smc5/6 complex component
MLVMSVLQCPLTGSLFVEPVAAKVCSHVFSKAAIMQHIKICAKDKRDCKCPVPGCGRIIASKDLEEHGPTVDALKLQALKVKEERRADSDDEVSLLAQYFVERRRSDASFYENSI